MGFFLVCKEADNRESDFPIEYLFLGLLIFMIQDHMSR